MKFVTFQRGSHAAPGLVLDDGSIRDLGSAFPTLHALVAGGESALATVRNLRNHAPVVAAKEAKLVAPIPHPAKNVFCVGRNYKEHVAEGYRARGQEVKLPEFPQFFTKPPTSVIGPDAAFPLDPKVTQKLDYEVELGVVIGRTGKDIQPERALDHVFGYTIINDVTARDLQRRHDQWFKGKGLDCSCPMGPWIVPASELGDAQKLDLWLTVNGEERQRSNTSMMIFDLKRIIADLSSGMTLEAGDVIATGTPSGVGFAMDPPRFLKAGDVVVCHIEKIGELKTTITEARR
jgi:2-keto-4-pentenoate hydratase/2-oxohepta-3-ene-1,7-dioic acid hydratase in catechol pathway